MSGEPVHSGEQPDFGVRSILTTEYSEIAGSKKGHISLQKGRCGLSLNLLEGNSLRNDCTEKKVQIVAFRLSSIIENYLQGFLCVANKIQYCLKQYLSDGG